MITYYNTSKADKVRATESFQDTLIRQAYEQGQKKNNVSDKQKNRPVSQAFFNRLFADKMPRLATCMTGVETIGPAQKKILVIASPEMIGFMYELGYDRSRIDFLAIQDWQIDLAIQQGIDKSRITMLKSTKGQSVKKDIEEHIKKTVTLNKYDAVIMNPPWEFTNEFRTLARALTKPDGVIGCIADAKSAQDLDWTKISEFEYTAHSFAGVQLNSVVSIEQKRPVSETLLKDLQGNAISIDPEQIATPPKVDLEQWRPANGVVKQIKSGKLTGYTLSNEGSLHRREWESEQASNGIETMATVGETGMPIKTAKIDRALAHKIGNINDHMVVFGADYTTGQIGPVKYKKPGIGMANRVHGIRVKNEAEAKRVIAHLQSDAVKRLVSVIKYTAKNSKGVFAQIPSHHNTTDWMKAFD
jgi:hypothetical protein